MEKLKEPKQSNFTASVKPSRVQYRKEGDEMIYSSQVGETWNNSSRPKRPILEGSKITSYSKLELLKSIPT
jgi:hypothetical protein